VDALTIDRALRAAKLEDAPREWLRARLSQRRTALVAYGYQQTTPCDVTAIAEATDKTPAQLRILDRSIFQGFTPTSQRTFRVRFLDDEGGLLFPERSIAATGAFTSISLPTSLLRRDYFVLQVLAYLGTHAAPEPLEV